MRWWRGLFRFWVGGVAVLVVILLLASAGNAVYAPQTNDAYECLIAAIVLAGIGLFGAWVLRGFKPS